MALSPQFESPHLDFPQGIAHLGAIESAILRGERPQPQRIARFWCTQLSSSWRLLLATFLDAISDGHLSFASKGCCNSRWVLASLCFAEPNPAVALTKKGEKVNGRLSSTSLELYKPHMKNSQQKNIRSVSVAVRITVFHLEELRIGNSC